MNDGTSDWNWEASEASEPDGERSHDEMDDKTEGQVLLLQSKATATLAAQASGRFTMVIAQLDELWALSCMEKVFCMATWAQVAAQAARAVSAELSLVIGDSEGKVKTDPTEEDKLAESFMNCIIGGEEDLVEPAVNAMHDYLHEATETQGRQVFVTILFACASATKACMAKAVGSENSGLIEL